MWENLFLIRLKLGKLGTCCLMALNWRFFVITKLYLFLRFMKCFILSIWGTCLTFCGEAIFLVTQLSIRICFVGLNLLL